MLFFSYYRDPDWDYKNNDYYERLDVDGFPYFVNGAGGHMLEWNSEINVLSPYSERLISDDFGATIVDVNDTKIHLQYFTRDGALRDELVLEKWTLE